MVVPIAVAFTIVITLCLHVSFLFFLMFSSCFYFNHKALLCNITFLMDKHGETLTARQAVCKSTRNIYNLLSEILNLTFHKTWASHWGKTAVCDLLYIGRKCLRVNYQCYLWSFHFKSIHCSGIWWPNDKNTYFFFCNEHRLILLCGHYNYHYNEPLWANAIFSILWLFIYFPICFLAIHGKYRYSVQFIQELKSNQIKAEGRFVNSCFRYFI